MWYQANLFFAYEQYRAELKSLVEAVDHGDLNRLRAEAENVAVSSQFKPFVKKFGFGEILPLPDVREVEDSPYRNSMLGEWLFITMEKYLEPSPVCLGYDWRVVTESLESLGWAKNEIDLLINGYPIAKMLGKGYLDKSVVGHDDPYWFWIRPLHSYNQGGWIPTEDCGRLSARLKEMLQKDLEGRLDSESDFLATKNETWTFSLSRGIKNLISVFDLAIEKGCGIYSAIFWDWNDRES